MFTVNVSKDRYVEYEIKDNANNSCIKVLPEAGGIITAFNIGDDEIFYLDRELLDKGEIKAGGNPVLFPVCGRLKNGQYWVKGEEFSLPLHGFARKMPWVVKEVKEGETGGISLELSETEDTLKQYPFQFKITFTYILKGNELYIAQEYVNNSDKDMPFYAGFHPYFKVSDKKKLVFSINADKYYYNSVEQQYNGKINFDNPVDFVFPLNDYKDVRYDMKDAGKKHKIIIEGDDLFKHMVLWTMEDKDFVCIEPWMAAPDAMNTGNGLYMLPPGNSVRTWIKITAQPVV